jgi:hypothetical protein
MSSYPRTGSGAPESLSSRMDRAAAGMAALGASRAGTSVKSYTPAPAPAPSYGTGVGAGVPTAPSSYTGVLAPAYTSYPGKRANRKQKRSSKKQSKSRKNKSYKARK